MEYASIKILIKDKRVFLGFDGKPNVYKTRKTAQEEADKLPKKYQARVVEAMPVFNIK